MVLEFFKGGADKPLEEIEEMIVQMLVIGAPPSLMLKLMVALPLELATEVLVGAAGAPIGVTETALD